MTGLNGSGCVQLDQSVASCARVYDRLLGGKDNYTVDQRVVDDLLEIVPGLRELARANHDIRCRGVEFLAREVGLRQFLDLGAGLPTGTNTHQIAQRYWPDATVVYVDNDPIALAHGRALLQSNRHVQVVAADLRRPAEVLAHPDVRRVIDIDQPVAVLLTAVLDHLRDDDDPAGVVAGYMDALPVGSHVFITHLVDSCSEARRLEEVFLDRLRSGRFRTPDEILALFCEHELVEPGLVYLAEWRRIRRPKPSVVDQLMVGGIARKQ